MPGLPAWTQITGRRIAAASRISSQAFALMLLTWLTSILQGQHKLVISLGETAVAMGLASHGRGHR